MATKAQKLRVGVFAAVTGALLVVVVVVFAGMRFWEGRDTYRIVFDGSVMGLEDGALVYLNGMRVGGVDAIEPAPDDLRKVRVTISVREGTPIHADTRAMLQFAGITGVKVIDLRDGTRSSPRLPEGATIAHGETLIDRLEQQAETLTDQTDQLMRRANQIVENLVQISDPQRFAGMDAIMREATVTAQNLAAASAALKALVAENRTTLRASIASIEETATSATALLDGQVSQILASAGGFVAELESMVSTNQTALRSAVFDLRQASRSFKELAREVRQRPSRLLFSSAPAERKLP